MSSSKHIPFLLTGVTGGLGAKILDDMLHKHHVPATSIIATSRSESNRARFESQGLLFREADYHRKDTLVAAFEGVEQVLFMSSSTRDNEVRMREHTNVIEAAREAGVAKVWYVSLAFGGWDDGSKIGFQKAHYETEDLLVSSGLDFVSLRAGVYTDAFPLFLNWYPSSKAVLLPKVTPPVTTSNIAFTTRDDIGEGIAALLANGLKSYPSIQPRTKKNLILLTAPALVSLVELVGAINKGRGTNIPVEILEPQEWIDASAKDDEGGKGKPWFEARLVFTEGVTAGDAAVTDPALQTLLGRVPESGTAATERIVREDPGYTWHQNHVNRG